MMDIDDIKYWIRWIIGKPCYYLGWIVGAAYLGFNAGFVKTTTGADDKEV